LDSFYESNTIVSAPCPTCCATCLSAAQCTSCKTDCFLNLNLSCLTSCPERFFQNKQTWKCSPCPSECLNCDSNLSCVNCSSNDFRILSDKRCVPIDGYYDKSLQTAVPCLKICKTCTSLTVCKTCFNNTYLRSDNKCYTSCLASTYADNPSLTCKNCPSSCVMCKSAA